MSQQSNISQITVEKAVEQLKKAYSSLVKNGLPLHSFPSVMLWGQPGVGKSQGVRQLGKAIKACTGKTVVITDVRLLLFNPIDLRGIPTANADKTLAVWLKPKIFQMDESADIVNILFLDEISSAPQSVQASAYQITLDRTVGEHKLPDNCIVIAAGNRVSDRSVTFKMPKALANRLCHLEIRSDFDSWKRWALKSGINERVVGYLSFRQSALNQFGADDDLAFATPRSWEMVSNILNGVCNDVEEVYPLIAGCVGLGTAIEFRTWTKVFGSLPSVEDIFMGKASIVPKQADELYAVVSTMAVYAREKMINNMPAIANSINYALRLPPDFSMILIKDYLSLDERFEARLLKLPELGAWLSKNGKYVL